MSKKVLIFHASAGHGHKKIAEVTGRAFHRLGWAAESVQVIDALDYSPFLFKKMYPAVYYYLVKYMPSIWGWFYEVLDQPAVALAARPFRHFFNRIHGQRLLKLVEKENPDFIICAHFFTAELFSSARKAKKIKCPVMIIITDFFPHAFWLNEGTDVYWVMHKASKQALLRRGIDEKKIVPGGIPVDPQFKPQGKKKEILTEYGFSQDRMTLLMTSGSFGLGPYEEILEHLKIYANSIQCFMVCGNNDEMKQRLERQSYPFPVKIFGFIDFMEKLMEASDVLIAKPGGSTTIESLAKGLPMIILHPIPGQESRNARYLKEQEAAFFMEEPYQIKPLIYSLLHYAELRKNKLKAIARLAKPDSAESLAKYVADHLEVTV